MERICTILSESSSEYANSEQDEMASHGSHSVPECTTSSTTETVQSETASNSATFTLVRVVKTNILGSVLEKDYQKKIPQKERSVRLPHHHVTLILNYFLLLKDVQSFQISHLKSQLENCFVVVVEKSCHLSEVLSRTILHH